MQNNEAEKKLVELIAKCYDDPLRFVMFAFPWSHDPDLQFVELQEPWKSRYNSKYGPDVWFCEMCEEITAHMRKYPFQPPLPTKPLRYAVKSGHGIGKSAGVAMIMAWLLSTHPSCKGTITANTLGQLKTKTWPEISKWFHKLINRRWFEIQNSSQNRCVYKITNPDGCRVDAQTSDASKSEAFAGQHNVNGTSFYIFDEASKIDSKIWETAEGGLSDGEAYIFAFGNPTQNSGYFREIWRKFRNIWHRQSVDSREVQVTNKDKLENDIKTWGLDSDYTRVRILGTFPNASSNQKIPLDLLNEAFDRDQSWLPGDVKVMSLDVARGGDDNCVFAFRRGLHATSFRRQIYPGAEYRDSMRLAAKAQFIYNEFKPDYFFIDATGVGGPVADRLNQLDVHCIPINFANKSPNPYFANMRAYMANAFYLWLKAGGCLPRDEELETECGVVEYTHDRNDREILIPKDVIKKELGVSTDRFDAEILLHAMPTPPKAVGELKENFEQSQTYDPWAGIYH